MKRYGVIYADPPWKFSVYSDKGKGRSAEAHYNCLDFNDIKALPIAQYAADDYVLLLWVTDPFLFKAKEIIDAWGFEYKTVGFYWAKCSAWNNCTPYMPDARNWTIGTGYWTRANPEQCLLATKGHPKRLSADVRKLVISLRREHSRKPDEMYAYIERLCNGPYLELFARQRREGWDSIGDQVDSGIGERRWNSTITNRLDELVRKIEL